MTKIVQIKRFKFTQANIAALPSNPKSSPSTDLEVSDTVVIGLKVLVGKNANKKFLFRYTFNSKKRSIAIGTFGAFSVDEARVIANQHRASLTKGIDPRQLREEALVSSMSFEEFARTLYLPHA